MNECVVCKSVEGLAESENYWTQNGEDAPIKAASGRSFYGKQWFCPIHFPEPTGRVAKLEDWPQ